MPTSYKAGYEVSNPRFAGVNADQRSRFHARGQQVRDPIQSRLAHGQPARCSIPAREFPEMRSLAGRGGAGRDRGGSGGSPRSAAAESRGGPEPGRGGTRCGTRNPVQRGRRGNGGGLAVNGAGGRRLARRAVAAWRGGRRGRIGRTTAQRAARRRVLRGRPAGAPVARRDEPPLHAAGLKHRGRMPLPVPARAPRGIGMPPPKTGPLPASRAAGDGAAGPPSPMIPQDLPQAAARSAPCASAVRRTPARPLRGRAAGPAGRSAIGAGGPPQRRTAGGPGRPRAPRPLSLGPPGTSPVPSRVPLRRA